MTKPLVQQVAIIKDKWFEELILDCRAIVVESETTAKWALIEGYHMLGTRILSEYKKFNRLRMKDDEMIKSIAHGLARSTRTIYNAIKFAREYPSLDALPEGKNINWHSICQKYLSSSGGLGKVGILDKKVGVGIASSEIVQPEPSMEVNELQKQLLDIETFINEEIERLELANGVLTGYTLSLLKQMKARFFTKG